MSLYRCDANTEDNGRVLMKGDKVDEIILKIRKGDYWSDEETCKQLKTEPYRNANHRMALMIYFQNMKSSGLQGKIVKVKG